MKILGVDSSLETRKLLKEYIEKMGHKLVLAKQGYEALKIIETEKERFDLFLFEADLQGLSGYEICHKIKDMTNCNNIPVILLMKGDSSEKKFVAIKLMRMHF